MNKTSLVRCIRMLDFFTIIVPSVLLVVNWLYKGFWLEHLDHSTRSQCRQGSPESLETFETIPVGMDELKVLEIRDLSFLL